MHERAILRNEPKRNKGINMRSNKGEGMFSTTKESEITYTSYCFLKGAIARGELKAKVRIVQHQRGEIKYETYPLMVLPQINLKPLKSERTNKNIRKRNERVLYF